MSHPVDDMTQVRSPWGRGDPAGTFRYLLVNLPIFPGSDPSVPGILIDRAAEDAGFFRGHDSRSAAWLCDIEEGPWCVHAHG